MMSVIEEGQKFIKHQEELKKLKELEEAEEHSGITASLGKRKTPLSTSMSNNKRQKSGKGNKK